MIHDSDIHQLHLLAELANCNPFSPHRIQLEKTILGKQFVPEDMISWNRRHDYHPNDRPNVIALSQRTIQLIERITSSSADSSSTLPAEHAQAYWDVVAYGLLYRHITPVPYPIFEPGNKKASSQIASIWESFYADYRSWLKVGKYFPLNKGAAAHLLSCLVQVHRAFWLVFDHILGDSAPISRLRETVWESVFGCDLTRYHDGLYSQMREIATLITGPSGTGKELVARAIGLSQYIPFDLESESFKPMEHRFLPINLAALSPTLIESELFGHRRGSFTGAVEDRIGWLEACNPNGGVFLDEIGELDASLQVKLLRVLQERVYCRLGENQPRPFLGKIISATNRDLVVEIQAQRFREDFYFRICSDRIETPSLREQLNDRPEDLFTLVLWIAKRLMGDPSERRPQSLESSQTRPSSATHRSQATKLSTGDRSQSSRQLAESACDWIEKNLGSNYPWFGNIRELEQCIYSFSLRRKYVPLELIPSNQANQIPSWVHPIIAGTLTADELLRSYCSSLYERTGSYEETARILGIDRRTVKAKLNPPR